MQPTGEKKYLLWMNKHQQTLEKYAGLWVGIKLGKGIVASGKTLHQVRQDFLKHYPDESPHLLRVPPRGKHFYVLHRHGKQGAGEIPAARKDRGHFR